MIGRGEGRRGASGSTTVAANATAHAGPPLMPLTASPSAEVRAIPSSWTGIDAVTDAEALAALEAYKKKDPSKGTLSSDDKYPEIDCWDNIARNSDHSIQGGWERAYHEAELLQGHRVKSVSSRHPVFEKGTGLEGWRAFGVSHNLHINEKGSRDVL